MKEITQKDHPRKSGNIGPVLGGIFAMLLVLFLFNAQYYTGQLYYWFSVASSTPAAVTPATPAPVVNSQQESAAPQITRVSKDPKIIIPGIDVNAPVVYGMTNTDEPSVQRALQDGVLHFAGSPLPGQNGNGIFVGHSSNAPWAPGNYKFVFAPLEQLNINDTFNLHYDGVQYTYKITVKKVVAPEDVSVLAPTTHPSVTLITCTPVGTNLNRLVIHADQISPSPTAGDSATDTQPAATALPGAN